MLDGFAALRQHIDASAAETRAELRAYVDASAAETRAELRAYVDASAAETRAELRAYVDATARETRGHFGVVAESMMAKLELVVEGLRGTNERLDRFQAEVHGQFTRVDRRLLRLEVRIPRPRRR